MTGQGDEPGPGDAVYVARHLQWAHRIVDAAIPLSAPPEEQPVTEAWRADRMAMRLEAFRFMLGQETDLSGTPGDLLALWHGTVPGSPG